VSHAFVAFGERQVGGNTERYCWYKKFKPFPSAGNYTPELNNECELRAQARAMNGDFSSNVDEQYSPKNETDFWIEILRNNYGLKTDL
jgi:hypothetical protein